MSISEFFKSMIDWNALSIHRDKKEKVLIDKELFDSLDRLGIIPTEDNNRMYNIGASDYSRHIIQPWSIIHEYDLDYLKGSMLKRLLRSKSTDSSYQDMKKIKHEAGEWIRRHEMNDLRKNVTQCIFVERIPESTL